MKRSIIIWFSAVLSLNLLNAQVSDLIFSQHSTTYTEITGGTVLGNSSSDDQRFVDPAVTLGGTATTGPGLPIGFDFVFNGQVFNRFAVNTNGWISLGNSSLNPAVDINSTSGYTPLSSTVTHNPSYLRSRIACFARDLQAQTGSELRYETIGTAPNRVLVIQWKGYRKYGNTGDNFNFQIRLYETTNVVEFVYGNMINNTTSAVVQVGLGGSNSNDFNNRTTTNDWLNTTNGTTNAATCSIATAVLPPNGTVFRWTPPSCSSPSSLTATNVTSNSALISWTSTASEFELEYGTQGFTIGTGTRIQGINTTSYQIMGLNPTTSYQAYVRAICGPGDTSNWNVVSFTTQCANITAFPWSENFSGSTFPPSCWMRAQGQLTANTNFTSTTTSNWIADGFANVGTTGAARVNIYSTNRFEWLITPAIDLGNGTTNYKLEFDLALTKFAQTTPPDQNGTDDKFAVVISTDGGQTWSSTNILRLWDNQGSTYVYNNISHTGQRVVINLTGYTGVVKIGFYGESTLSNADNDLFIDNIVVKELSTCPDPHSLIASNITGNSLQLSWTPGGTETSWNIEYGPLGFTQGTGTIISGVTNPYTITGLNPSTTYTFYVQADCGGGEFSPWSLPASFTTTQIPATLPYFLDFEAGTEQLTIVNGNFINKWHHGSAAAFGGTKSIYISNDNGVSNAYTINSASTVHFYRDISFPNTPNPLMLEFAWRNFGEASLSFDYLKVYMIPTSQFPIAGTQLTATQVGSTYNQQSTWQIASIPLHDSLKGKTKRFVFSWYNDGSVGTQPPAAVDNIHFYELTCPKPTSLSATNITQNSATLTWTAGGNETQWQVQWGVGGFTIGTGNTQNTTTNSLNLSALSSSSSYTFYVRAICGVGDTSVWAGPYHFTTLCGSITAVHTQNFDAVTTPALPNCWSSIVIGNSGSPSVASTSLSSSTPPNSVQLFNSTASGSSTHILLITPQFSDLPSQTTQITFKARFSGSGTPVLYVGTMSDPANPATFSNYQTIMTLTSSWQEFSVAFNNYTGTNQYIAFKHGLGMTNQTIYIDDVVYEFIPSCPKPNNLTVSNITGTTADVSWTAGGTESSWDLIYGPQGFDPNNSGTLVEGINTTNYTITGLNPTTTYQVYVLAQCSASDSSTWRGPFTFTTTQIPATLPYIWDFENDFQEWSVVNGTQTNKWHTGTATFASPTKAAYISNTNGTTNNYDGSVTSVVHIYRDIQFPAGTEFLLSFKWKGVGESTFDYMRVFLENSSFVPQAGVLPTSQYIGQQYYNQNNTWQTANITLDNSYANSIRRLIFTWRNDASVTNQPPIAIDDISINVITCPKPINLTVYNVGPNSAQLSWTEQGSATQWQVQFGPQGFAVGTGTIETTTSNPHTVTNLTAGINNSFYVRSICGAGDTSVWAGPFTFYVPCNAFTATYTQNFDAVTTPNLPACWLKKVVGSTSAYVQTSTSTPSSSPNCAVLYNSSAQGSNAHILLISPAFSDINSQLTRIKFKYRGNTTEKLILGTMTDPTDENTFTPLITYNIPSNTTWTQAIYYFNNYTGTGQYIAFKHATQATYTYVYIDDFVYEPLPNTDFAVTKLLSPTSGCGLTSTEPISIRIKNLATQPYSNINVGYSINGTPITPETITQTLNPGDSIDYTFNTTANLSAYTTYLIKAYVSYANDEDLTNDTIVKSINNVPLITNLPYFEDFEAGQAHWIAKGINSSWQYGTPAGTVITAAASGTKAWVTNLTGYYNNNENSWVESPCFDFSNLTNPYISLKRLVHAENSWDGAAIQVSIDGGTVWHHIGSMNSGQNWYNDNTINGLAFCGSQEGWTGITSPSWITSSHHVTPLAGLTNVKFRIVFGSDGSVNSYEGFAFDDFRIYEPVDVAIVYPIDSSTTNTCGLTSNQNISVWIKNVATSAIQAGEQMIVAYSLNNGTPVQSTFTLANPLLAGDSVQFTFPQPIDMSSYTTYFFRYWVRYTPDFNTSNDTIVQTIVHYNIYVNISGGDTVCVDPIFLPYTLTLQPYPHGYDSYLWSNASGSQIGTSPFFDVMQYGWYYITVTDENCTATDSIFICNPVTIESYNYPRFSVFPSPAPVKLFVNAEGLSLDNYNISLSSVDGKTLYNATFENTNTLNVEILTETLSEGVYILTISNSVKTWKFKVVK